MRGMTAVVGGPWLRTLRVAAAAACALLAAACASDRSTAPLIPSSAPRIVGAESGYDRERGRLLAVFGGEYQAPAVRSLLDDVVRRLVAASAEPGRAYRVTLLNSPAPNAFALPSGDLFVTRGLLALANDTSEIAAVMAHEIAHVTARHALQRAELERRSEIVERVVAEVLDDPAAGETVQIRNRIGLAGFSRAQELEADEIGVAMTAAAGFDPFGAARFLETLGRDAALRAGSAGETGKRSMNFLSTHPRTPERIARVLAVARAAPKTAVPDRAAENARWLAALDGILHGDDPRAGLIRDRRFIHPLLGFTFTAPDGASLENSPQAVVGMIAGRQAALRFDSLRTNTTPEDALGRGWIEGVSMGRLEPLTVSGLPAATVLAAGQDWSYRIAAIRQGDLLHRFIFAARDMTPELDRMFMATLASFRLVTTEEAGRARSHVLRIVTAQPGDGIERFARMMDTDRAAERFRVLNGIEGQALVVGRSYKVIAE